MKRAGQMETEFPLPRQALPSKPNGQLSPRNWRETGNETHCVLDGFLANVQAMPEAPALCEEGACWSYSHLFSLSTRVARRLAEAPGRPVLILAPQDRLSAAATIGAILADHPICCIDRFTPPAQALAAAHKIGACSTISVAGHPDFDEHRIALERHGFEIIDLSDALEDDTPWKPVPQRRGEDILGYAFTSGTTGTPKLLADSHRYRADVYRRWIDHYGIGPDDNLAVQSTFKYDAMFDITVALSAGASATILPDEGFLDGRAWFESLRRQRITSLMVMASALRVALETGPKTLLLPALRRIIIIGESLSAHLLALIRERMPDTVELHNCFGISEALFIADRRINGLDAGCANAFDFDTEAMMEVEFTPPPERGELGAGAEVLSLRGAGLFSGYLDERGAIAQPVRGRWTTSDAFGPPGRCGRRYLGRTGRAFVVCGHLVEPGEIEQALLRCRGVAAARCRLDALSETIRCEVETTAPEPPHAEALAAHLDRRLLEFIEVSIAREGLKGKRR